MAGLSNRADKKNDFIGKMIDFDTITKIAKECGRFGQNYCCQRL